MYSRTRIPLDWFKTTAASSLGSLSGGETAIRVMSSSSWAGSSRPSYHRVGLQQHVSVCRMMIQYQHKMTVSTLGRRQWIVSSTPCGSITDRPRCHFAASATESTSSNNIPMTAIKELRALSGAPILECKKALQEIQSNSDRGDATEWDIQAAMDWLRQHGAAKVSAKVQGREASEGLIGLVIANNSETTNSNRPTAAVLVKLCSETDFASRSETFGQLVLQVANAILHLQLEQSPAIDSTTTTRANVLNVDTVLHSAGRVKDGLTVAALLDEAVVSIRENISLTNASYLSCPFDKNNNALLIGYVHNRITESVPAGSAAAVVLVQSSADGGNIAISNETLQHVGKKLAMHIVAARPLYLSPEDVPVHHVEHERTILTKQLEQEEQQQGGKRKHRPPEILQKIVTGRMNKFFESVCLTEQAHMIEEKNPKVSQVLKEYGVEIKAFETMSIP